MNIWLKVKSYLSLIATILVITNEWVFQLINNEYLPMNLKKVTLFICLILFITMSIRLDADALMAQWNVTIQRFKVCYYLQKNIRSKHRLIQENCRKITEKLQENYRKISILAKLLYLICFKIALSAAEQLQVATLNYLYIAIRLKNGQFN